MKITSVEEFEKQWKALAHEIGKKILEDPTVAELKKSRAENGFLSLAEKSQFILIADKIKYDLIYEKYGEHGSSGFEEFKKFWQKWLGEKGVASSEPVSKSQQSANHFMYGSTPDPEVFLRDFQP